MLYVWGSDIYDFSQKAFYIKHYLTTNRTNFFENHKNDYNVCYFGEHAVSNALDNVLDIVKCFISDNKCSKNFIFILTYLRGQFQILLKYFYCSYMTGNSQSGLYHCDSWTQCVPFHVCDAS